MVPSHTDRTRWRAILIAREVKWLLMVTPDRLRVAGTRLIWNWLFKAEDGRVHRAGEILLADLRDYAALGRVVVDEDPILMARREGRRDVVVRMTNYLALDETVVQKMMEIDDGFE